MGLAMGIKLKRCRNIPKFVRNLINHRNAQITVPVTQRMHVRHRLYVLNTTALVDSKRLLFNLHLLQTK